MEITLICDQNTEGDLQVTDDSTTTYVSVLWTNFLKSFFLKKRQEQTLLSNYSTIGINLNEVDVSVFQTFTLTSKCCCPDGCAGSSPPPAGGGSGGISVGTVILIV